MRIFTLLILSFVFVCSISAQTTHVIETSSNVFTPNAVAAVKIGDTIQWSWISGIHTTTSTTIPSGASTWDAPVSNSDQVFKYVVHVAGVYNYKCTPHEGMGMIGSFTVDAATGIDESHLRTVFAGPNPVHDILNISFSNNSGGKGKLSVLDIMGKSVISRDIEMNGNDPDIQVNVGDLKEGIYFIRLSINGNSSKPIQILKD
jgi:plastocyanin